MCPCLFTLEEAVNRCESQPPPQANLDTIYILYVHFARVQMQFYVGVAVFFSHSLSSPSASISVFRAYVISSWCPSCMLAKKIGRHMKVCTRPTCDRAFDDSISINHLAQAHEAQLWLTDGGPSLKAETPVLKKITYPTIFVTCNPITHKG